MTLDLWSRLSQLSRSLLARRHARARGIPGLEFDDFGRRVGIRLLIARKRLGWAYLVNPVSITRYWEFSFAADELPHGIRQAADISSPRLFSFWLASNNPNLSIDLLNPDPRDTAASKTMAETLGQARVVPATHAVDELSRTTGYDAIWSLSVVEHISGVYNDSDAVRMMYEALRPGGHLILTVPVDRKHRHEYRATDLYGTQHRENGTGFFFQRVYDMHSLQKRLIEALPNISVVSLRWFGEREPGHFLAYEQDWMERGIERTVDDPREIADQYCEYSSWSEMPGMGVCGLHLLRTP